MVKTIVTGLLALVMQSAVCAEINFDNPSKISLKDEIQKIEMNLPAPESAGKAASQAKEWTVMVYINAKNNLEFFGLKDVNEMEMIGSSAKVNVVVELGRMSGYDSSDGDWAGSRRYLVKKDNNPASVTSTVLQDLGAVDMGDYRHLAEFGQWAKANFPAKKYMLIVWNHGSGWNKFDMRVPGRGISYDDETGNHITTAQLAMSLNAMGGANVYGSDACLMQMAEVVYEIKDSVEQIVGSEETEPGDGYTYDSLLGPLMANPAMTPEQLGRLTVDAYSDHYQSIEQGATQSLVRSAALNGFAVAVSEFANAVIAAGEKPMVRQAIFASQFYSTTDNKDLFHFVDLVVQGTKDQAVVQKGNALKEYIARSLVAHNRVITDEYANSHGIAIYLPMYNFDVNYRRLAWTKASGWDKFIGWYQKR